MRRLALMAVAMFGFGFALVPLYSVFCEITGLNGKTGGPVAAAAVPALVDKNRVVTVEFLSAVKAGLPWEFRPVTRKMTVHPGEIVEMQYIVRNRSNSAVVGQAVPSVAPGSAAKHFHKIECFCFTRQTLAAGERRQMMVRFVLDPDLSAAVSVVTLSYTFFPSPTADRKLNLVDSEQPADSRAAWWPTNEQAGKNSVDLADRNMRKVR